MARSFNGSSQSLEVTRTTTLEPAFPIAVGAWIKASSGSQTFRYLISKFLLEGEHASYAFGTNGSTGLAFHIGWGTSSGNETASPAIANNTWNDGNWHYILGTYDGSNVRIYNNGTEQGSGTAETSAIAYDTGAGFNLFFGKFSDGSYDGYGQGTLADVAVWGAIPNADERTALAKGVPGHLIRRDALKGYWPLYGVAVPEPDLSGAVQNAAAGAVANGAFAEHAPVGRYALTLDALAPTAAAGDQTISIGQVTETETSPASTVLLEVAAGQTTETETSQATTPLREVAVGQGTETESSPASTVLLDVAVGQPSETESAQAITVQQGQTFTLGQVTETETSQATTVLLTAVLGQPSETESSQAVAPEKAVAFGLTAETETSQAVTRLWGVLLGQPTEAELAQAITLTGPITVQLAQVTETEQAPALVIVGGAAPPPPPPVKATGVRVILPRQRYRVLNDRMWIQR